MEEIEAGGEYINTMLNKIAKEQSKVIDDIVFNFLKQNGYKPRRTEKYDKFSYYKKVTYILKFIDIGGI